MAPWTLGPVKVRSEMVMSDESRWRRKRYPEVSTFLVFVSPSGRASVEGDQDLVWVMMVLPMPAPLMVIPDLGSRNCPRV